MEPTTYSIKSGVEFLLSQLSNGCCPNCGSRYDFNTNFDEKTTNGSQDSHWCNCGQEWTTAYRIVYHPTTVTPNQ